MALVKNPLMSLEARGTIGGITYTWSLAGWIAKSKPRPAGSIDGVRPWIRSILGWLSRQWGRLTDDQRQAWRDWALEHPGTNKFGDSFIMSGINAYIKLNHSAVRFFGANAKNALPPAIPPVSGVNYLTAVTGAGNPGEIDLTWSELGTGIAADKWEIQAAGPFQSPGRVEVEARFANISTVPGDLLLKTLPGLNEGFWYHLRVRYIALDGQTTAWNYGHATPKAA